MDHNILNLNFCTCHFLLPRMPVSPLFTWSALLYSYSMTNSINSLFKHQFLKEALGWRSRDFDLPVALLDYKTNENLCPTAHEKAFASLETRCLDLMSVLYFSITNTEWEQKCTKNGDGKKGIQSDKSKLLWLEGNKQKSLLESEKLERQ